MTCGTAVLERKWDNLTSSLVNGFSLDFIIEDIVNLERSNTHVIPEEGIECAYQSIIDLCIKNKRTEPYVLNTLLDLRDKRYVPDYNLLRLREVLTGFNRDYLRETRDLLENFQ